MNQKNLFKDNTPGESGLPAEGSVQPGAWWTLHTDGAARGNPGPAGAGAVLRDENGSLLAEVSRFLGRGTNNEAEYQGLIFGLEEALGLGARRLKMRLDSELVVKQVLGLYRVKNKRLRPLYQRVMTLLQDLEAYDILHIRREKNTEADALASRAAVSGATRGRK